MEVSLPTPAQAQPQSSKAVRIFREVRRYPLVPILILIVILIIPAIFAPWIAPYHPIDDGSLPNRLSRRVGGGRHLGPRAGNRQAGPRHPEPHHSRARKYVLLVSLSVIFVSGVIGVSLGLMAGYFGGWMTT